MKSLIKPLAIILIAQLGLFGFLQANNETFEPFKTDETILNFDKNKVSKLEIKTPEEALVLEKSNGAWVVPTKNNFPADENKVEQLITKLSYASRSIPIGSTETTQKQLKVTADEFEKKITIMTGENSSELILGTSPGFKKNYVRNIKEETIYTASTGDWSLETEPKSWLDFEYLYFDASKVSLYSSNVFDLNKTDKGFMIPDSDKELDQKNVVDYLKRISKIRFTELLEEKPKGLSKKPELYFSVMTPDGEKLYNFFKEKEGTNYIVEVSGSPFVLRIPGSYIAGIKETTVDSLVLKENEAKDSNSQ